jgi:tRNA wybutosine-synthesizing protein 3
MKEERDDYSNPEKRKRIPLDWLESKKTPKDTDEIILPSFVDLERKTILTLYGDGGDDKSPKGSVDGPIRPLVDLINRHSSYCTLSSCSGRVSLFNPNGRDDGEMATSNDATANKSETSAKSGKGTGRWLLVSHHPIEGSELVSCFLSEDGKLNEHNITRVPWIFKLEPLLLHVAARSLQKGRQLLQLALELGFRESGLVVTDTRVTVAIRGHSLALGVPLAPSGPLRPPTDFLHALVQQANQRLLKNWHQLDRLYDQMLSSCFQVNVSPKLQMSMLPPLNLWNAATVAVPGSSNARDIFAFGGYGIGPNKRSGMNSRRSNSIYKLTRRNNEWDSEWEQVNLEIGATTSWNGLEVTWLSILPDCQGTEACILPKKNWVVLWGGRSGPKKALQDLYLMDPTTQYAAMASPKDVRGDAPSPRWGHKFVAIDDNTLMVTGGCNLDQGALDDVHLLHFCDTYFYWERFSISLPTPLFHHMTIASGRTVYIFGGLRSTTQALEPFQTSSNYRTEPLWAYRFAEPINQEDGSLTTAGFIINKTQIPEGGNAFERFGASACITDSSLVLISGGLASTNDRDPVPLQLFFLSTNKDKIVATSIQIEYSDETEIDFGCLVHHSCISLGANEFLLLGGGVTSFAFGNSFAK